MPKIPPPVNGTLMKKSKKIKTKVKKNKIKRNKRIIADRIGTKDSGGRPWSTKKKTLVGVGAIGTVAVVGSAAAAIYNKDKIKGYFKLRKLRKGVLAFAYCYGGKELRCMVSKFLGNSGNCIRLQSHDLQSGVLYFTLYLAEMRCSVDLCVYVGEGDDCKSSRCGLLVKKNSPFYLSILSWLSNRCFSGVIFEEFVDCFCVCLLSDLVSSISSQLRNEGIEFVAGMSPITFVDVEIELLIDKVKVKGIGNTGDERPMTGVVKAKDFNFMDDVIEEDDVIKDS